MNKENEPIRAMSAVKAAELEGIHLLLQVAEDQRRERPTPDMTGPVSGTMDYASSGQAMEQAMMHLRESLPNGQKVRTEAAFLALQVAMRHHKDWLRARGYEV